MKTAIEPKTYRVECRVAGPVTEPFVDWYQANSKSEAETLAREDMHRYGLPDDTAIKIREANATELRLLAE